MKAIHLSYSDISGGAARAAYRIHKCLQSSGINSCMWVNKVMTDDWSVFGPQSRREKLATFLRPHLGSLAKLTFQSDNPIIHSPAILPSKWIDRINSSDADIIHLHWINGEMLSIADIGRINKPIIWNLHDMWPFCGAEHYTLNNRWRAGYNQNNRPVSERGFDLNRWTWRRKKRHWKQPMTIVANSQWLETCAKSSALFCTWNTSTIHYPLDMNIWSPVNRFEARSLLGLPRENPLLLYGAIRGSKDPRKGFDLLMQALEHLEKITSIQDIQIIVFGQSKPETQPTLQFPIHFMGHLYDDLSLRILYSACDAMVVPSRQEAFGQTALEAHACGTPVIAFKTGGLPDTVLHKETGYLANPFDPEDLANGIDWVLAQRHTGKLGIHAREWSERRFSIQTVAQKYTDLYHSILPKKDD